MLRACPASLSLPPEPGPWADRPQPILAGMRQAHSVLGGTPESLGPRLGARAPGPPPGPRPGPWLMLAPFPSQEGVRGGGCRRGCFRRMLAARRLWFFRLGFRSGRAEGGNRNATPPCPEATAKAKAGRPAPPAGLLLDVMPHSPSAQRQVQVPGTLPLHSSVGPGVPASHVPAAPGDHGGGPLARRRASSSFLPVFFLLSSHD